MLSLNKDHIQRQFDRCANSYDQVAQMQRDIVADLASLMNVDLVSNSSLNVLDAGCGTGYGLQILQQQCRSATFKGLDLAPEMLKVAQQQSPNAEFVQGDIERLPFGDNQFDLTWSSSAIQWCDFANAVDEIKRVTKPEGAILLSTFTAGTLRQWREIWGVQSAERFINLAEIERALTSAGLDNVSIIEKTYEQSFTSFSSAVNSIRELGAGNAEVSRSQGLLGVERYRSIKAQVSQVIKSEGQIVLPYNVVLISANKAKESTL